MAPRADTLHIRRHVVHRRVTRGGAEDTMSSSIAEMLAQQLADVVLPGDPDGVWLIRRLDVRACVAAWWTPSRIARTLAIGVTRALERALEGGPDGEAVRWFPDRAAFLARFLVDSVDGRAAGRWEYAEFAASTRDPSVAIRAAIVREPETALRALVRVGMIDLRRILDRLAPVDAAGVLEAFAAVTGPGGDDPAPLVVAALRRLVDRSALPDEPRAAALALFLEAARRRGPVLPEGTAGRAHEIASLRAVLRASPQPETAQTVADGRWSAVGADVLSRLAELVGWPAEPRREAVGVLERVRSGAPEHARDRDPPLLATGLGGMFLVLPLLDEFPWRAMTDGWPSLDGIDPSRLARFLTVVAALGAGRNSAAAIDPVLRLAVGIPGGLGAPAIDEWTREIEPEAVLRSMAGLIGELVTAGKASGAVTIAPLTDGVVAVDGARGIWLGTAPASPESIRALVESIDAALGEPAAAAGSEAWIEACLAAGKHPPEAIDLRFLFRLSSQAEYATVGEPFHLPPAVRELFLLTAQAIGRELAWRLPGFSRSSLMYLSENLLEFGATIQIEPERFVVRMGDPPLHLLLSLAGLNRRSFRLDATGDREWVLTQEH